ncbi:PREDICTED: rabenosyn-5 [Propithecus coquereli]|uniref:rabenosyn-5 n=1 Tax=Propithecus coquereli TaxID=379532 RepID=UPI00063F33D8|nr:PREDICTED: rabenosyn-5 [Propithecus coquereli]
MASLDDPGDVREGFLCPLCLKDLQSFYQLQSHYEEEHSGEDRDVKGQIKNKLTSASKDSLSAHASPSQSPTGVHGSRRGSSSSLGSVSSVLDDKDDGIRCCTHCKDTLLRREQQLDEKERTPDIAKLYEMQRSYSGGGSGPVESHRLGEEHGAGPGVLGANWSLWRPHVESGVQGISCFPGTAAAFAGETTYSLEHASDLRAEVQRVYELIDALSHLADFKKHRAARIDHYVVEVNKLIIRLEKLTAFDRTNTESAKIRAIEKSVVPWVNDRDVPFCPDCGSKFSIRNRRHHCRLCGSIMCRKCTELIGLPLASRWRAAEAPHPGSLPGPEKLLGLMSLPTTEQFEELKKKRKEEMERKRAKERQDADPLLQQIRNIASFARQARAAGRADEVRTLRENLRQLQAAYEQQQTQRAAELSRREAEAEALQRQQLRVLREREREREQWRAALHARTRSLDFREARPFPREPDPGSLPRSGASRPDAGPPPNPFAEEAPRGYNPFEEDEDEDEDEAGSAAPNPFDPEDGPGPQSAPSPPAPGNPFEEPAGANPFEPGGGGGAERIEEELLLQQIDNVRAFIFDARQRGRGDEVHVLTEHLRELRAALAAQKGGAG